MAKAIDSITASALQELIDGTKTPSRLTPVLAVNLSLLGCIENIDGRLHLTKKARRTISRHNKQCKQNLCDALVENTLRKEILTEPGIVVQHRQVWDAVGESFSRAQVLSSLRTLRLQGFLKSFKASNNNFQVFWALASDEPRAEGFVINQ